MSEAQGAGAMSEKRGDSVLERRKAENRVSMGPQSRPTLAHDRQNHDFRLTGQQTHQLPSG